MGRSWNNVFLTHFFHRFLYSTRSAWHRLQHACTLIHSGVVFLSLSSEQYCIGPIHTLHLWLHGISLVHLAPSQCQGVPGVLVLAPQAASCLQLCLYLLSHHRKACSRSNADFPYYNQGRFPLQQPMQISQYSTGQLSAVLYSPLLYSTVR